MSRYAPFANIQESFWLNEPRKVHQAIEEVALRREKYCETNDYLHGVLPTAEDPLEIDLAQEAASMKG